MSNNKISDSIIIKVGHGILSIPRKLNKSSHRKADQDINEGDQKLSPDLCEHPHTKNFKNS